jgi:hypothetical protein
MERLLVEQLYFRKVIFITSDYYTMQESIHLKLSAQQQQLLKTDTNSTPRLIGEVIPVYAEQIGYMLQAYYPRQKVSKVEIMSDTIGLYDNGVVHLKLTYLLEEFNACSAIDREDKEKMPVKVTLDEDGEALLLTGEYWPSRD